MSVFRNRDTDVIIASSDSLPFKFYVLNTVQIGLRWERQDTQTHANILIKHFRPQSGASDLQTCTTVDVITVKSYIWWTFKMLIFHIYWMSDLLLIQWSISACREGPIYPRGSVAEAYTYCAILPMLLFHSFLLSPLSVLSLPFSLSSFHPSFLFHCLCE